MAEPLEAIKETAHSTPEIDQLLAAAENLQISVPDEPSGRVTKREYGERVQAVAGWFLAGLSRSEVHAMIQHYGWGKSRNANLLIKKARSIYGGVLERKRKIGLAESVARRELLYRNSMLEKDYKLALEILKDLDKLLGNYAPEASVSASYQKDIDKLSTDELEEIARIGIKVTK